MIDDGRAKSLCKVVINKLKLFIFTAWINHERRTESFTQLSNDQNCPNKELTRNNSQGAVTVE